MSNTEATQPVSNPRPLVRHSRRDDWGRALMLWEREGKRGYQFEDGKLRVIAEGYFELLQSARKPDPVLRYQLRERAIQNGYVPHEITDKNGRVAKPSKPLPNLEDQMEVFEALYPAGFQDAAWIKKVRGNVEGRRNKGHRDAAIADAQEQLGVEALQTCLSEGRYAEVLERFLSVLRATDLATKTQLAVFDGLVVDKELAESIVSFLHDIRGEVLEPMARLRIALARQDVRKISWGVLTAPRALLYPADHMYIRASALRAQAKLMAPRYKPSTAPTAADYSRSLELAMSVREQLTKENFAPRDLFDVAAFMRVTLGAAVKPQLLEAMVRRRSATAQPSKPPSQ